MLVPQCFWPIKLTSVVLEHLIDGQPLHRPCYLAPHNSVSLLVCHLSPLATNQHLTQCTISHFVESKHRHCYNCENGVRNDATNQCIFLFFKINRGERIKALSLLKSFSAFFSYSSSILVIMPINPVFEPCIHGQNASTELVIFSCEVGQPVAIV